jgi:hypothetical protein
VFMFPLSQGRANKTGLVAVVLPLSIHLRWSSAVIPLKPKYGLNGAPSLYWSCRERV